MEDTEKSKLFHAKSYYLMREKEFLPLLAEKLNIAELNPMQKEMLRISSEKRDVILLSPTGSGKTVAFLLPMLKYLKPSNGQLQGVVLAPSRELVIQISRVVQALASGYKTVAVYGGHKMEDEVNSLAAGCDIIVATPGRLTDHLKRRTADVITARLLVLDEFDKMVELGFEDEMKRIINRLKNVSRTILTSATRADILPEYLGLNNPVEVDYLEENADLKKRLRVHRVDSDSNDKLESLYHLISNIESEKKEHQRIIVFVNHRESAERVYQFLSRRKVPAVLYHGALDQRDREKAIAVFNNGSRPVLVATDLAARGLDIEDVGAVIHYHQALTEEAFTHRNGRTARVDREGDVYLLVGPQENLQPFSSVDDTRYLDTSLTADFGAGYETLFFSAGKKEKLSKGDIVGFLIKEGGLEGADISKIDVYDHYSLAAVRKDKVKEALQTIRGKKIKGEKRMISIVD